MTRITRVSTAVLVGLGLLGGATSAKAGSPAFSSIMQAQSKLSTIESDTLRYKADRLVTAARDALNDNSRSKAHAALAQEVHDLIDGTNDAAH